MADITETLCGATVQHGLSSNRIYLMKIGDADPSDLIRSMDELAVQRGYTKIFAKVPAAAADFFLNAGYSREAEVPRFYHGQESAVFLGRYYETTRSQAECADELERILQLALQRQGLGIQHKLPPGVAIRICCEDDADAMAAIYRQVFPSYPFPIDDPHYIIETMRSHVMYLGVDSGGQLLALSSAEMDRGGANAEMTDFATLPTSLGRGFAAALLAAMEPEAAKQGIRTAYTIARAASPGMNISFARLGYEFGGRLINNTQISGAIESMNVWHKPLDL